MLTSSYIQSIFDYKDGNLYNKDFRGPRAVKGGLVGSINPTNGYWRVQIKGKSYQLGRVIWAWHGNELNPKIEIDHINGDKLDNRIENLRATTRQQNEWNKDHLGVRFEAGKWRARYKHQNKYRHIGMFDTKEEAIAAYISTIKPIRNEYLRSAI
jgi:hypothetical protein